MRKFLREWNPFVLRRLLREALATIANYERIVTDAKVQLSASIETASVALETNATERRLREEATAGEPLPKPVNEYVN